MLTDEIINYIEAHETETYELLKTIAQIPAPSHQEDQRMEFCRRWLLEAGAEGVYTDEAKNVIYPVHVTADCPLIVFMAHMDVVFPDTEPLPLLEKDNRLYCPGIGDDTANLAALLMASKYIAQTGQVPKEYGILIVCNSCEEGMGNLKGSRCICEHYGKRIHALYSFDGTMKGVVNRAVGSSRFRVTVKTEGGHSYSRFGNRNAIAGLAAIISDIYGIQVPEEGKTTYNVGVIEGGTSVNTIAQEAQMLCEYRSDRIEGLTVMEQKFQEVFERHSCNVEALEVEVVGQRPCENLTEEQRCRRDAMVLQACDLLKHYTGEQPQVSSGSTDCNIPLSLGIPSICYGAYYGDGAHTREEYIEIESLKTGYRVVFESILAYF